jgi:Flp pilus assembly protein TadD
MTATAAEMIPTDSTSVPPADLATMVQAGSDALGDGDLRAALEHFEQVIKSFPEQAEGHNNLGALYTSLGEFAKAEECFDRVLDLLPSNANILYNRGVVRSRLEKFDDARKDFEGALKFSPKDADLHNNLGVVAYLQGRFPAARKHLRKAGKFDPTNTNVVLNLCDVEVADGNYAVAVSLCEDSLSKQNNLEIRRRLFDLLSSGCRQALEKASKAAETLLVKDTENQQARAELGKLLQARSVLSSKTV